MSKEIVKPCPFCGKAPRIADRYLGEPCAPRAWCVCLGSSNGLSLKDWNTRPVETAIQAEHSKTSILLDVNFDRAEAAEAHLAEVERENGELREILREFVAYQYINNRAASATEDEDLMARARAALKGER